MGSVSENLESCKETRNSRIVGFIGLTCTKRLGLLVTAEGCPVVPGLLSTINGDAPFLLRNLIWPFESVSEVVDGLRAD